MSNYMVFSESLVVNFDGHTETIAKSDSRFKKVIQAIREEREDDIPSIVSGNLSLEVEGLEIKDGMVSLDGEVMPESLAKRLIALRELDLPITRVKAFWENLKDNPSFNSKKMLFEFLEHNGHPFTDDGCFIAYRGVNEDLTDCHTSTFDNSPGSVCKMERSDVDDDPTRTCSNGLHVACYDYAEGFGNVTVEVKVNPKNVVCVPKDYDGTKMRVCEFEVLKTTTSERNEILHNQNEVGNDDETSILNAYWQFQDKYNKEALVTRISEATGASESRVERCLTDEIAIEDLEKTGLDYLEC